MCETTDEQGGFAQVVIAPLRGLAPRSRGTTRPRVPTVRPMVDRVQKQSLVVSRLAQVRARIVDERRERAKPGLGVARSVLVTFLEAPAVYRSRGT